MVANLIPVIKVSLKKNVGASKTFLYPTPLYHHHLNTKYATDNNRLIIRNG